MKKSELKQIIREVIQENDTQRKLNFRKTMDELWERSRRFGEYLDKIEKDEK